MKNSTLNQLQEIFRFFFKNEAIILSLETTAQDIARWDSLTHLDLINELENKFNITFSFEEILKMKKVEDLVKLIDIKTA